MTSLKICLLAACVSVSSISAASAQTVSSNVSGVEGGVFSEDPQGPSASEVNSALTFFDASTIDFGREGFGRASQRPDGVAAVVADAVFANGATGNYAEATTSWTQTATNSSGVAQDYVFDFLITPPSLRIGDYAGLSELSANRPDVSFEVTILVDGIPAFSAEAHLIGGLVSHVLNETGTSLSPTAVGSGSDFGYDFASYADILDLGSVPNGGSISVTYLMTVRVDTPGFETGGRANIGDPFDLSGSPGFTGSLMPASPVATEPTTWGKLKRTP